MKEENGSPNISDTIDDRLSWLARVVDMVAATIGPHCEIVLHDLRKPATSVVHVANGHVTNRAVGQGIRDLLGILQAPDFRDDTLLNYAPPIQVGDRVIRSSTAIFRNAEEEPVCALCINLDVTEFHRIQQAMGELTRNLLPVPPSSGVVEEHGVPDVVGQIVENTIESYGKSIEDMDKRDKMEIIRFLESRGAFDMRGVVGQVADALGVSRHSIYKYLQEVRRTKLASDA